MSGSGKSVISASVVRIMAAMLAAFSSAPRVIQVGFGEAYNIRIAGFFLRGANILDDDIPVLAGVLGDLAHRRFQGGAQDPDARSSICTLY